MKIYFNGCSATYGDELADREKDCWTTLVAQHQGATEYFNDAARGGSNDRIWSKTIANIDHYDKFYIQWSFIDRFTLTDPSNGWEVSFQEQLINFHYDNVDYYQTFGKYYYAYWSNPLQNYVNWLNQIISLQALFQSKNKKYLMFSLDKRIAKPFPYYIEPYTEDRFIKTVHKHIDLDTIDITHTVNLLNTLVSNIDLDRFVNRSHFHTDFRGTPQCDQYQAPLGHGNKEQHQLVAKEILKYEGL